MALAWPLAAFGGVYRWATAPYLVAVALLALTQTGRIRQLCTSDGWLYGTLATVVTLAWLQLVPLPAAAVAWASPATLTVVDTIRLLPRATGWTPISVSPLDTAWACALLTANALLFVAAGALVARGGVRATIRVIAWLGIVFGLVALSQMATGTNAIYWRWVPYSEGATPFGTFVNRNHFASWVIMATPVCFGYVIARLHRTAGDDSTLRWTSRLATGLDGRALILLFAAVLMSVALFLSLSRSGLVGLATAAGFMLIAGRRHVDRKRWRWLGVYGAITATVVAMFADATDLVGRLLETLDEGSGRLTIWRETMPVVRDFWAAGTGAGTYQTAMLVYQESNRLFVFNQAHNQLLQVATEGGLLLSVPALGVTVLFVTRARRRIGADHMASRWIRLGAAGGLVAVGVQSLWETGLRMPANAALAVVLAAIVIHAPRQDRHDNGGSHGIAAGV